MTHKLNSLVKFGIGLLLAGSASLWAGLRPYLAGPLGGLVC